jgi:hypothetical protein
MFSKTQTAFPVAIAIRTGVSTMNWSTARRFRLSWWSQVKRCEPWQWKEHCYERHHD